MSYRCRNVFKYIPQFKIKKASQWCILNRKHALKLIENKEKMEQYFKNTYFSDEHCYITFLYDCYPNEIINTKTTSVRWHEYNQIHKGLIKRAPFEYLLIDKNFLDTLLNDATNRNVFFIRKIRRNCLLSYQLSDAFPGQNSLILPNKNINNPNHIEEALYICRNNSYGGFVDFGNIFYFRNQSVEELMDLDNIKTIEHLAIYKHSTLVLALTLEDYLIKLIK
jgi:hypothetical protein